MGCRANQALEAASGCKTLARLSKQAKISPHAPPPHPLHSSARQPSSAPAAAAAARANAVKIRLGCVALTAAFIG